ncbi:four-carbon acid sugar kinase family protein [Aestuariivirga litoralis]|uniref:four-carbon acid sugar kinase family protein n=1 Tax=Aestuariivirga litoralis TaxID=2650924 RepID=UPI0018C7EABA|nr:four-carbon acid sugar kinase family protein [Aestuariivirga litoralis]MBG1232423.1 four-carbon acid sugar kinase family protein [Aestuariivirga litoralis]
MSRLITYYGDDFTGSTDVMEALASHGVKTVLFTKVPSAAQLAPFKDYEAIGLAGTSRSQTPDWMDTHLPGVFAWLNTLDGRFCHYKVCSTFDSSPKVGSIGRATEIGLKVFNQQRAALVVGAPQLKRYTFAGHLFAGYQGKTYRIDRHPVMSVHPVTPMDETDVLRHLARQTAAQVDLLDVHDAATQKAAGEALLNLKPDSLPFMVGSSGVEYALMSAMSKKRDAHFAAVAAVAQMLVISGSVSPTTERQIKFAAENGFSVLPADALSLAKGDASSILTQARTLMSEGKSPLIYSASGPSSDQGEALKAIPKGRETLSKTLGSIARKLISEFKLKRLVIAGGDTSSHALGELDIYALTTRFPLVETPGSPLCLARSASPDFDGLEVAMKGGQVGGDDYFVRLKNGLN